MNQLQLTPLDTLVDESWGKKGTPCRDAMEIELENEINSCNVGEAIKEARCKQKLTQQELAERIGVQRSQVSRIESGRNLTLATVSRVFKALGMNVSLNVSGLGIFTL